MDREKVKMKYDQVKSVVKYNVMFTGHIVLSHLMCLFTTVTMVGCAAPHCKSRAGKSFYRFPKDPGKRKLWVQATKRAGSDGYTPWKPKPGSRLCEVGDCKSAHRAFSVNNLEMFILVFVFPY